MTAATISLRMPALRVAEHPSEEVAEAVDRVAFQLEMQRDGFWFGLVAGNDARARSAVRLAVRETCGRRRVPFHLHVVSPQALPELAWSILQSADRGLHWVVADGYREPADTWASSAARLFMALNERREALRRRLGAGLVVEGREELKRTLRELAPDLFSIRSFIVEPGSSRGWPAAATAAEVREGAGTADPEAPRRSLERLARAEAGEGRAAREALLVARERAVEGLLEAERLHQAEALLEEHRAELEEFVRQERTGAWEAERVRRVLLLEGRAELLRGRAAEARARIKDALTAAEADPDPTRSARGRREAHDLLARLAEDQGHPGEALRQARLALAAAHALVRAGGADDRERRRTLAIAHNKLGDAALVLGRADEAEEAYLEAQELRRRLLAEDPASPVLRRDLAFCHDKLGDLERFRGRLRPALEHAEAALRIRLELASAEGAGWSASRDLATAWDRRGDLARVLGAPDEAIEHHARARELRRALASAMPESGPLRGELAWTEATLGDLHWERGDTERGLEHHRAALRLRRSLGEASAARLDALAESFESTAELLWELEAWEEADDHFRRALRLRERLGRLRRDHPDDLRRLGRLQLRLSETAALVDDLERALRHGHDAVARLREALEMRPEPGAAAELADALEELAELYEELDRPEDAEALRREAEEPTR